MRTLSLLAPLATLTLLAAPTNTEMALTSADGFALKGTLTLPAAKGKAPVVILAHQFGANRADWAPLAERLAARGIGTLALDLRGHGASTEKAGTQVAVTKQFMDSAKTVGFDKIPADLAQAAAWLRKQPGVDGRRLGLAGASLGGFSVILASPAVKPLAILTLSPAGSDAFGNGALANLKAAQLRGRATVLVLASSDDKEAFANAQALRDLPGVDVNLKDGNEHGFAYFKERADLMAVFFGEYLTYHHTGQTYAAASAKPAAKEESSVISDQNLAEQKKTPNPK